MFPSDQQLEHLYQQATERTLTGWQQQPDIGNLLSVPRYAQDKFALTAGITPVINAEIQSLLATLHQLAAEDPLADVMPPGAVHFTFLAITPPHYDTADAQDDFRQLTQAFQTITPLRVRLEKLRLVALPGQLLLAGIPDAYSLAMRAAFTQQLLASPWQNALHQRYPHTPLPPPFWHSTLLRYEAEQLPLHFRAFFMQHQHRFYGAVDAPLKLVMSNYNWSKARVIAASP